MQFKSKTQHPSRYLLFAVLLAAGATCGAQDMSLTGVIALASPPKPPAPSRACASETAQAASPLAKMGMKAYSIPISSTQIYLTLSTPDTETATIRVQEGAMGKIIGVKTSKGFAVIPTVNAVDGNSVSFKVFSLNVDEKGNESIRELGDVVGSAGEEKSLESAQGLRIKLKQIEVPTSIRSTELRSTPPIKVQ